MVSSRMAGLFLVLVLVLAVTTTVSSQDDTEMSETQRIAAEKFMQVLAKRPRPGTALDRVYDYHAQSETLGKLIEDLTTDGKSGQADAGSKFFLAGLLQRQQGRDADAVQSLASAEPLTDDAMVSFYLGQTLLRIGNTEAAAAALQRSIDRRPVKAEAVQVYMELGRIYQRERQGDRANRVWKQLEETFPGDARVGVQIAEALADEGMFAEALAQYEKLAQQNKSSQDAKGINFAMQAAELKHKLGRQPEAIKDLESILAKLRPGSWLHGEARRQIEASLLSGGDFGALADYYAKHLRLHPDDLDVTMRMSRALMRAGRLVEAEATLSGVTQRAPNDVDLRIALIDVLRAARKTGEMVKQYEAINKLDSANPDYLVQWGNALLVDAAVPLETRREAAAAVWRRLLTVRPADPVTISQVANLLRRVERTDEAVALFRKAIEVAPDQPQYREYLGEYLHQLNRKDEAVAAWQSLAEGDRRTADSLIRLAEVLSMFDEHEKAIAAFKDAAMFDLEFSQRLRFASLLFKAERYDDSLRQLDDAESIAETPEEHEQVLKQRIAAYKNSGQLAEQIDRLHATANSSDDFRRLALMNDAAEQPLPALEAIQHALDLSPKDIAVLSIAGEFYRTQSRPGEAIKIYVTLAEIDRRFRTSYLQRIAELQMQAGMIADALATASEIINASPNSSTSHHFYADLCFQAGRDDEGLASLRRAARIAPRDNDIRNDLALALVQRLHADEAIELYWQSFMAAEDIAEKSVAVRSLTPLYDRQGEFAELKSRLEQFGRDKSDSRQAAILIAEAYEVTGDLVAARATLQALVIENPRDIELLTRIVRFSLSLGDKEIALESQQQLVALADTPENRKRLLTLMIDSGLVAATAVLEQSRGDVGTPGLVAIVDRAIVAENHALAIAICRDLLKQQSDRWEVKARLAFCLLCIADDGDYAEAASIAREMLAMQVADDTRAATLPLPITPSQTATPAVSVIPSFGTSTLPFSRSKSVSVYPTGFAIRFRLGAYKNFASPASSVRNLMLGTNQLNIGTNQLHIERFYQARDVAIGVLMVIAEKRRRMSDQFNEYAGPAAVNDSSELRQLWDAHFANGYRVAFTAPSTTTEPLISDEVSQQIESRLVRRDNAEAKTLLINLLLSRRKRQAGMAFVSGVVVSNRSTSLPEQPLIPPLLELVISFGEELLSKRSESNNIHLLTLIHHELQLAGQVAFAEWMSREFDSGSDIRSLMQAVSFFLAISDQEKATSKLTAARELLKTVPLAQREVGVLNQMRSDALQLIPNQTEPKQLRELLVTAMQSEIDIRESSPNRSTGVIQSSGFVPTVISSNGRRIQVQAYPLSRTLFDQTSARIYNASMKIGTGDDRRFVDLVASIRDQAKDEGNVKLQIHAGAVHAFACWWSNDPSQAHESMRSLAESFPDHDDLQMEAARFATEFGHPAEALEALDKIQTLDQDMLQAREVQTLSLTIQLRQFDRAREIASRLVTMKLDTRTQLVLLGQLDQLGLKELSRSLLNRVQQRSTALSADDLLQLANRLDADGDKVAAGQVAAQLLKRASSGGQRQGNFDVKIQTAIRLLRHAGMLDAIVTQTKNRAKAAPNSAPIQHELEVLERALQLDLVAGDRQRLSRFGRASINPEASIGSASLFAGQPSTGKTLELYLQAAKTNPRLIDRHAVQLSQIATTPEQLEDVFKTMLTLDLSQVEPRLLDTLLGLQSPGRKQADSYPDFVAKLIQTVPVESVPNLLRLFDESGNKETLPVVDHAMRLLYAERSTYETGGVFASDASISSGAKVTGPLTRYLKIVKNNAELTDVVSKAVNDHADVDGCRAIASVIQIALDANDADSQTIAADVDHFVVKYSSVVPPRLIRELSQILDQRPETVPSAIKLLESVDVVADTQNDLQDFQSGVGNQLSAAYLKAGRRDECINRLMVAFLRQITMESTGQADEDRSRSDYSLLTSLDAIGKRLEECSAPLEAAIVWQFARSNLDELVSSLLSKKGNHPLNPRTRLESAIALISAERALDYVTRQTQRLKMLSARPGSSSNLANPDVLIAFQIGSFTDSNDKSLSAIQVACELLKADDAGRRALEQLDESMTQVADRTHVVDKLHLAAGRTLIAMAIAPDSAPERFTSLVAIMPTAKDLQAELPPIDAAGVLEFATVAILGLDSGHRETAKAAQPLAATLSGIAEQQLDVKTFKSIVKALSRVALE